MCHSETVLSHNRLRLEGLSHVAFETKSGFVSRRLIKRTQQAPRICWRFAIPSHRLTPSHESQMRRSRLSHLIVQPYKGARDETGTDTRTEIRLLRGDVAGSRSLGLPSFCGHQRSANLGGNTRRHTGSRQASNRLPYYHPCGMPRFSWALSAWTRQWTHAA